MNEPALLITGLALADADGVLGTGAGAAVLFERGAKGGMLELVAVGEEARVHPRARHARRIDRPRACLIPALVNAHTHLDLTHFGPRPYNPEQGFVSWVDMVRAGRATEPAAIRDSVRRGVELSLRGGVVAIGDIAGAPGGVPSLEPWRVAREMGELGVSFLEFFGIGKGAERGAAAISRVLGEAGTLHADPAECRLGLQPHAPNTVSLANYQRAVRLSREHGLRLSTHLAETAEEREFVGFASGPQRGLLERLGIWDDSMLEEIGAERHPVEHLAPVLAEASFLAAHVNDADDAAIETLARTGTVVAYCPRASAYFGAPQRFGPHRYKEMLAAGIRVALGTDSIINLDTPGRMSVLDDMRLLVRRDGLAPATALAMGTVHGAAALGLPTEWFSFRQAGMHAGVVAVEVPGGEDVLAGVFSGGEPELVAWRGGVLAGSVL